MLVVSFFLFRVLPGDPARTLGRGRFTTEEQLDEFSRTYGLDQPLPQQFLTFLKNTVTGDLGISLRYRVPVSDLIVDRMWPTLLLVGTSILAAVIGVWLGVPGAGTGGGPFDKVHRRLADALLDARVVARPAADRPARGGDRARSPGSSRPVGCTRSTPIRARSAGVLDTAWHLFLPVLTLTLAYLADYALIMRGSLLDELGEDYLTTARAKGLRDVAVRNRHAVRNALLPTTTVVALNIGFVVTGAITVETVFSIPGLGLLATEALTVPGLLGAPGHLPGGLRRRHPGQPGGQPALRLARPRVRT